MLICWSVFPNHTLLMSQPGCENPEYFLAHCVYFRLQPWMTQQKRDPSLMHSCAPLPGRVPPMTPCLTASLSPPLLRTPFGKIIYHICIYSYMYICMHAHTLTDMEIDVPFLNQVCACEAVHVSVCVCLWLWVYKRVWTFNSFFYDNSSSVSLFILVFVVN